MGGWNAESVIREITVWLQDPFNETLLYQEPLIVLTDFSEGKQFELGQVLASLTTLADWYASQGIVEIFNGGSTDKLCDSFWCEFFYNSMMKFSFQKAQKKKGSFLSRFSEKESQTKPRICFDDQGLLLAKAFALGLLAEGERIGYDSLTGLKDGWFYGIRGDDVTPFILSVFARWKGLDLPANLSVAEGYQPLLESLTAQANGDFETAVAKACDFHLSQLATNEFAKPTDVVFPFEILFVMRVRESLGLQNPNVDHPLLNSPLGTLPAVGCSMKPLLRPIHERIQREFSFHG